MRQRLLAMMTIAFIAFLAAPADANVLTSATVSDNCTGYTIGVAGIRLYRPSTVTYRITLTSSGGAQTVGGSIPVSPNSAGNFSASQSAKWSAFGIRLNGTYGLSGSATLSSNGSTLRSRSHRPR